MYKHRLTFAFAALLAITLMTAISISANVFADDREQLIERHLIPMEGGRNFRDMGGYTTADGRTLKKGQLYRSGVLHHLTEADYQTIEQLDIGTVVDLRATEERHSEPTEWQAGNINMLTWDYEMNLDGNDALFTRLAQPGVTAQDAELVMAEMYRDMVSQQRPHYAAMFEELATSGDALLFHCSAGKDRTGIAAALVMTALGMDRDTVMADFTLSEAILTDPRFANSAPALDEQMSDEQNAQYAALAQLPQPAIAALMGTRPIYLETAFDEMTKQYGSVDAYIKDGLGVSEEEIAALRGRLLE